MCLKWGGGGRGAGERHLHMKLPGTQVRFCCVALWLMCVWGQGGL